MQDQKIMSGGVSNGLEPLPITFISEEETDGVIKNEVKKNVKETVPNRIPVTVDLTNHPNKPEQSSQNIKEESEVTETKVAETTEVKRVGKQRLIPTEDDLNAFLADLQQMDGPDYLRNLLKFSGTTQKELATAIGINFTYINTYVVRKKNLKPNQIQAIVDHMKANTEFKTKWPKVWTTLDINRFTFATSETTS